MLSFVTCANCKEKVPDSSRFCPSCGANTATGKLPDIDKAPEPVRVVGPVKQGYQWGTAEIFGAVIGILAIILIAGYFILIAS